MNSFHNKVLVTKMDYLKVLDYHNLDNTSIVISTHPSLVRNVITFNFGKLKWYQFIKRSRINKCLKYLKHHSPIMVKLDYIINGESSTYGGYNV